MPRFVAMTADDALFGRLAGALQDPGYSLGRARDLRAVRGADLLLLDGRHPDCANVLEAAAGDPGAWPPVLLLEPKGEAVGGLPHALREAAGFRLRADAGRRPLREAVFSLLSRNRVEMDRYEADGLLLDFAAGRFFRFGAPLHLSASERRLLQLLIQNRGITLSREMILRRVWDRRVDSNTLSVVVRRLRGVLEEEPAQPRLLLTVYGGGYQWRGDFE